MTIRDPVTYVLRRTHEWAGQTQPFGAGGSLMECGGSLQIGMVVVLAIIIVVLIIVRKKQG